MSDVDPARGFAATLVEWQRTHGRQSLPWQQHGHVRDPYRVWLSEMMLQQTQVAAVLPYYARFLERFPDVRALAAASLDDVMQRWSGLGYYSRARNLHAAARRVVDAFDGRFPDDAEALETLPGVGRSTAAAIAAFAFGRKAAILDGNVKRVFARVFVLDGPSQGAAFTTRAWALAEALLPDDGIERYTQGLMDLGATVCTPRNPSCPICPFERTCGARRAGIEATLPQRAVRKSPPRRRATLAAFVRDGAVLLERRPPSGVWGGLWSLPEIERDAVAAAGARFGTVRSIDDARGFVHAFTHFVLEADVVRATLASASGVADVGASMRWVAFDALDTIGLPTPIRGVLETLAGTSPAIGPAIRSIDRADASVRSPRARRGRRDAS